MDLAIKAVFFDIDGTLLTDGRTVSQSTIHAINALKKQGILVGLATGRDPRFILQYMASLGLDVAVAYNGQYIFSRDAVLFTSELPSADVRELVDFAVTHRKEISFGTATGVAGSGIMSLGMGSLASRLVRLIPRSAAGFINFIFNRLVRRLHPQNKSEIFAQLEQPLYQLMLMSTEIESFRLQKRFPNFAFTRSNPYAVDVISKGNSKLEGIRRVGAHYGFTLDEAMVFGDSNNDVEMLTGVPHSVAMGNGTRRAKQVASYVTTSNNRDGIFKALQHFGLLEGEEDVSE